jgi:hypothetical protein
VAIGLEAKGYRESEMRAENVTGIANKVEKRDERVQEINPQGTNIQKHKTKMR